MGRNDGLARPGELAPFLEHRRRCFESCRYYPDGGIVRRPGDLIGKEALEHARAPEEDLPLVREVAEEGSLGEAGPRGDNPASPTVTSVESQLLVALMRTLALGQA